MAEKCNIKIISGQHFQQKIGDSIREDSLHHVKQKGITTTVFTTEHVSPSSQRHIHEMGYKEAECQEMLRILTCCGNETTTLKIL